MTDKQRFWLDVPRFLHAKVWQRPKKSRATIVLLHGVGNTGEAWRETIKKMPPDATIITVDLVGFGLSPKPDASYSNRLQARSVALTLAKLGVLRPVILVGHSMGSLIAIEFARRYSFMVRSMVLCSPPLYRSSKERRRVSGVVEAALEEMFHAVAADAHKNPQAYFTLASIVKKMRLASPAFNVNEETILPYAAALKTSIIRQTSLKDIKKLTMPIRIIYSPLDPFVVGANIKEIAKTRPNIQATQVVGLHEISAPYIPKIVKNVTKLMQDKG